MTTKEQRDEKAKAALLQRVMDIYAGVIGSFVDSDYSLSHPEHDGPNLRRLSTIFTQMTGGQCDDDWLCGHWETPAKASDYLFSLGIGVSSPPAAEKGQAEERVDTLNLAQLINMILEAHQLGFSSGKVAHEFTVVHTAAYAKIQLADLNNILTEIESKMDSQPTPSDRGSLEADERTYEERLVSVGWLIIYADGPIRFCRYKALAAARAMWSDCELKECFIKAEAIEQEAKK